MLSKRIIQVGIVLIVLIFSVTWSLHLIVHEWPTDFGHHFYISMNNDYTKLYNDFFTHKGPVLVMVFDFFQNIFLLKSNYKDSVIMLFLLCFTHLIIVYFVFLNLTKNSFITFLLLIYTTLFFRDQTSDIFVDLIVNSILLISFLYFIKFIKSQSKNTASVVLSIFFLFLAFLSRIDVVLYSLSFLLIAITLYRRDIKFFSKQNYKILFLIILTTLLIFILISKIYSFSFIEFYNQNVLFNLKYADDDYNKFSYLGNLYAFMPSKVFSYILILKIFFYYYFIKDNNLYKGILCILSLMQSLFFIYKVEIISIFFLIFILEILIIYLLTFFDKYDFKTLLFVLLLSFTSFFIFLYTGSTKLNHGMILYSGSIFLIYFILNKIFSIEARYKKIFIGIIIILFIYQGEKIYRSTLTPVVNSKYLDQKYGLKNFYFNESSITENQLVRLIKENNLPIICDRGWLRIFSNTKSFGILFDWWFWDTRKNIYSEKHKKYFKSLMNKEFGDNYLIDKICTENNEFGKNETLKKLLNNSKKANEYRIFDKVYYLYSINY
jgi:hypothetical protein